MTSVPAPVCTPLPATNALDAAFMPQAASVANVVRAIKTLLVVSVFISLVVNTEALTSWQNFAATYAYTLMYATGLWLTNGYMVAWLNGRYRWTERPGRRLLLTLAVSLGGSLAVILLMNAILLLVMIAWYLAGGLDLFILLGLAPGTPETV